MNRPSVVHALRQVKGAAHGVSVGGTFDRALHDARDALKHADDGTALDFLAMCERKEREGGAHREFWRRLAGTVRKAATL